jgi:hypothetical protein
VECCAYEGCAPQQVRHLIDEQSAHLLQSIHSDSEKTVKESIDSCQAQYDNWRKLLMELESFTMQCTTVVSTHSSKCAQFQNNARKTFSLMLEQFDSDHQGMERTFEQLLQSVSFASEQDIEERKQHAVELLSTMKDGFYVAKQKAMAFVVQQLQALKGHCAAHGLQLQLLLGALDSTTRNKPLAENQGNGDAAAEAVQQVVANTGGSSSEQAEMGSGLTVSAHNSSFPILQELLTWFHKRPVEEVDKKVFDSEQQKPAESTKLTPTASEGSSASQPVDNSEASAHQVRCQLSSNCTYSVLAFLSGSI